MSPWNRNILLVAGFAIIFVLAYKFSFLKTIEISHQLKELKEEIKFNSQTTYNKEMLLGKEIYLDSILEKEKRNNSSIQNDLLKKLNTYSEDFSFKLIQFQEPHIFSLEDQTVTSSFQFTLEGDYKSLEILLFLLERENNFGKISHFNFTRNRDYRLQKEFLRCKVIVQNVR